MKRKANKIPILDIPGLAAFQVYHQNEPELITQGTRVVAMFEATDKFYDLSERFNRNEPVSVLDFCNVQRQLKARMFAMRGSRQ